MKQLQCLNVDPLGSNGVAPELNHGQFYTIQKEHICSCGEKHYDVGLKSKLNFVECYKCRETLPNSTEIHWCHSSRFES